MTEDISKSVLFNSKTSRACECCGKYKMKANFYRWYSIIQKDEDNNRLLLGIVCNNCAIREGLGNKFLKKKRR
tara:strand:- start:143 stop:361 length:219 start_codon:yes stop_codon:yes gene_type:complete